MRWLRALVVPASLGLSAGCSGLSTISGATEAAATTSVTVYAKGATGDVAPLRTIVGPRTGLRFPSAIAVDVHGNRYVANRAANSVTVYSSYARGDAAPLRTIVGTRTGLNLPTGLALDSQGDVYVANRSADTITVYAPTASGNAVPITVDRTGAVYVVNSDDKDITGVLVFGPRARGDVAPIHVIAGSATKLLTPSGVAVDPSGAIFVSDHGGSRSAGAIRVYAKGADGNAAPIYSIAGTATRLRPYGITIGRTGEIDVVNQTE